MREIATVSSSKGASVRKSSKPPSAKAVVEWVEPQPVKTTRASNDLDNSVNLAVALREELKAGAKDRELLLERLLHATTQLRFQEAEAMGRAATLEAEKADLQRQLANLSAKLGDELNVMAASLASAEAAKANAEHRAAQRAAELAGERDNLALEIVAAGAAVAQLQTLLASQASEQLAQQQLLQTQLQATIAALDDSRGRAALLEEERQLLMIARTEADATLAEQEDQIRRLRAVVLAVAAATENDALANDFSIERNGLVMAITEIKARLGRREAEVQDLKAVIEAANRAMAEVETRVTSLSAERNTLALAIVSAESAAVEKEAHYTQQRAILTARVQELETKLDQERAEAAAANGTLARDYQGLAQRLAAVEAGKAERDGLVAEVHRLETECGQLAGKRALATTEIDRLQAERERLLGEIDRLEVLSRELADLKGQLARSRYFRARRAVGRMVSGMRKKK